MVQWLTNTLRQSAWAPASVVLFYAVADGKFDAYVRYPWLDIPTHFFGGVAIAYFFLVGIDYVQAFVGRVPRPIQLVLCVGLSELAAVGWEFSEYVCDVTLGTHMNLGVSDTISDLFFGLVGAVTMVMWHARYSRVAQTGLANLPVN